MVNDYQDYFRTAQPLFDPAAIRRTQAEHRAIARALQDRNVELARQLVAEHIRNAGLHIMRQFETRNPGRDADGSTAESANDDRRERQ
jgi:DNA-binding GntR family transcriptional regulator